MITLSEYRLDIEEGCIDKFVHEFLLVHELLHCKSPVFYNTDEPKTLEREIYNQHMHTLLNDLARSLILAKYPKISIEWFKNFQERSDLNG